MTDKIEGKTIVGYVLAINYGGEKGVQADWDGEVHKTLDAAWTECMRANGEEWAQEIRENGGLSDYDIQRADYLPFALVYAGGEPK